MPKQTSGSSQQQTQSPQSGQWVQPDQQDVQVQVPPHALERLKSMRGESGKRGLFTSDLSVNEFLLVKEAGFDPVGMVVGSSIYHIGYQRSVFNVSQEMQVLSQAMYTARELAMARMEAEADALGADGIVGVRLDVGRYEWGADLAEFIAIGTAVRSHDGTSHRTKFGKPFTSDLSGQDFRTLLQSGYRPLGLTMGTCVYHVAHQSLGQWFNTVGRNTEMQNFTQALYDARELAMERMQAEAVNLDAEGIVGTQIKESSHGWDSHVIEFFAVGTAVTPIRADHQIMPPQMVLTLNS
ncbi:MAG TPA: heavy metal-binding domain-containing protein [Ktedonobacterales bacterium]|nr:heavy metal-binding domain-containing protein [Ktedonobacterales bacterium]